MSAQGDERARPRAVLSVDGGGVRGLVPARVIARLEELVGAPCAHTFDLIAGTSTGAIVALGLAAPRTHAGARRGYTGAELEDVYLENAAAIFSRSFARRVVALDDLVEERYPASHLEEVLTRYFGEVRLSELTTEVVVPSYDLAHRAPWMFERARARADARHDMLVRRVARATSAAPTYFEPYEAEDPEGTPRLFVDGGVVANNPAMCALVRARELWPEASRIVLVSVGTGQLSEWIDHRQSLGWGAAGWAEPLLDIVFDGGSELVDQQLRMSLGQADYLRLQLPLEGASPSLDDPSPENLAALGRQADRVIAHFSPQLDALARELVGFTR
jgi:patatin-like phospholipase/acyl hydrolase